MINFHVLHLVGPARAPMAEPHWWRDDNFHASCERQSPFCQRLAHTLTCRRWKSDPSNWVCNAAGGFPQKRKCNEKHLRQVPLHGCCGKSVDLCHEPLTPSLR